jgi:hypothetical protein
MTLLWMEGFDRYDDGPDLQRMYSTGATSVNFPPGVDGIGNCVDLPNNSADLWIPVYPHADETTTITIGFHHFFVADTSHDFLLVKGEQSVTELRLRYEAGGEIAIDRGSTEIDVTTSLGLSTDTWYWIEFQFKVHDSTGLYELKVDEVSVLSDSGVDTKQTTGVTTIGTIFIPAPIGQSDYWFDNMYILDDNGLTNNDFLGEITVETLFPTSDGVTHTDFTPASGLTNYEMVDDGDLPDNGTTYNASSTVNHIDQFGVNALEVSDEGTIYGVMPVFTAWVFAPGPRQMRPSIRRASTDYEGDICYLSPEYQCFGTVWETDPNTGSAWSRTNLEAAEYGYTIEA